MSQARFFEFLGAPLRNTRWSWGAVRPKDGAVILREWKDHIFERGGERYARVWWLAAGRPPARELGARERLAHLDRIRAGAAGYIVVVVAGDVDAQPRKIVQVLASHLHPIEELTEIDGHVCARLGAPKRVEDL